MHEHEEHQCHHDHSEEWCRGEHHGHRHGGDCSYGHGEHHGYHHHGGDRSGECRCGCGASEPGMGFRRRFQTREEQISGLEEYLRGLQAEATAVEERIAQLRA